MLRFVNEIGVVVRFGFEWNGSTVVVKAVEICSMTIDQVRRRLSEVCSIQAKLDAEKLALSARMVSLLDDPVSPAYVIPERELVAHGGLTSHEARTVIARGLVTEVAPDMGAVLASGDTTAAHVDALGRGLKIAGVEREAFLVHLPELVEASTTMSASEFSHLVTETAKSVVTDDGLSTFERQQRETFFTIRNETDGCVT
ncbi:MAG: hypothetical protein F2956_07185, partial [Actinobacteria bacterium]|nr:hypothetical protein [Actinomycetota bacterium]